MGKINILYSLSQTQMADKVTLKIRQGSGEQFEV